MDLERFDHLTRIFGLRRSRRALAGALGLAALALPDLTAARKKRRKKGRTTKVPYNAFGCLNVGSLCQNNDQCCSGICAGKRGQPSSCRAHDTGGCTPEQSTREAGNASCTTSSGAPGECFLTTGNAGFCYDGEGQCFPCARDADCVPICGPHAACVVCELFCGRTSGGTACVGLDNSCTFPEP